jgi:hypothetical protein
LDKHFFKTTFQNSSTHELPCEAYNCHACLVIELNKLNACLTQALNLTPCGGASALTQDGGQRQALVNMVMNLEVP